MKAAHLLDLFAITTLNDQELKREVLEYDAGDQRQSEERNRSIQIVMRYLGLSWVTPTKDNQHQSINFEEIILFEEKYFFGF